MLQSIGYWPPINAGSIVAGGMKVKRGDNSGAAPSTSGSGAADADNGDGRSTKRPNRRPFSSEVPIEIAGGSELRAAEEVRSRGESAGLRLLELLLRCAEAVAVDRLAEAQMFLPEISELSSPYGSSPERVAAYFAEAIHARIVSSRIGVYSSFFSSSAASVPMYRELMLIQNEKIAQAFQVFNAISPFVKFAHFTANQAIFQALEGEESVHVIDLDIMQGLQWPGLFHILTSRHGHKIRSIRITGVGSSPELLGATGRRLSDFAAALGLSFEFHPMEVKVGHLTDTSVFHKQLPDSRREVTVVNWMHHCLYDVTGSDLGALRLLQALKPKLVVIVEQDLTHAGGFLQRFVEALHYYSAMFDALGEAAAATSPEERCLVERLLLGTEIRNILAVGGPKRTGEVMVERWSEKLRRAGFSMVNLAGSAASAQAGLLLGMLPCKGYTLGEEGGCLRLDWKDLSLFTASAWQPDPAGTQ